MSEEETGWPALPATPTAPSCTTCAVPARNGRRSIIVARRNLQPGQVERSETHQARSHSATVIAKFKMVPAKAEPV